MSTLKPNPNNQPPNISPKKLQAKQNQWARERMAFRDAAARFASAETDLELQRTATALNAIALSGTDLKVTSKSIHDLAVLSTALVEARGSVANLGIEAVIQNVTKEKNLSFTAAGRDGIPAVLIQRLDRLVG